MLMDFSDRLMFLTVWGIPPLSFVGTRTVIALASLGAMVNSGHGLFRIQETVG